MGKLEDSLRYRAIAARLEEINTATLDLAKELISAGVHASAIDVEFWPKYDETAISLKLWDGKDHYFKPSGKGICLTTDNVLTIANRRQILRRKF